MAGFYTSAKWLRKKAWILRRDKYICQDCKRYGKKTEAVLVHHIVPYEEEPGLKLDEKNLVSLCEACHNKRHPEKGRRRVPPVNERGKQDLRNGNGQVFPPRGSRTQKNMKGDLEEWKK